MFSALGRLRKRNTGKKRPGFHIQQLQNSSRGAAAGGGVGLGRGFWWGLGTKAPVSLDPRLCHKANRLYLNLIFCLSFHAQTPSGNGRTSSVKGVCMRLQRKPSPGLGTEDREPSEGEAGEQWAGCGLGGVGSAQGERWETTAQANAAVRYSCCLPPHPRKVKQNPNKSLTWQILIPQSQGWCASRRPLLPPSVSISG